MKYIDKLLDPKIDYVFKRIFGYVGNEEITKGLISSIIQKEISNVKLDNNTILEKDLLGDKVGILDIRAKIEGKINCNIEMQIVDRKNIEKRILYYWSKLYSMNLKAGKVDAVILDKPVAQQVLLTNDGCKILEGVKLVSSEIGVVINKNNPELLKQINGVIKELKETGKLQELIAKYFSTEKAVETTATENTENTVTSETTDEVVNTATNEAADEVENATTGEEVKEKTTEQSTVNAEDNK